MNPNFQIEFRNSRGNLHVRPSGNFDGISAWTLLNFIHEKYDHRGNVFVDTRHLHHTCPFACKTFRCGINFGIVPTERLFFKGKKGFDMAPEGSRVIEGSQKHKCCGNCENCPCSGSKKAVNQTHSLS
ncbi:MAG: hypothetical protein R2941_07830 [Desulfobacterales bacterium]